MPVDIHPSRKPSLPVRPPATSTTDGSPNTIRKTGTGAGLMDYGCGNGNGLKLGGEGASGRYGNLEALTSHNGMAAKAGPKKSHVDVGGVSAKPGTQKGDGSPG